MRPSMAQEPMVISSKHLKRDISITTLQTTKDLGEKPIIYFTDGQKFINNKGIEVISKLTRSGKIPEAYYVFISTIDQQTVE